MRQRRILFLDNARLTAYKTGGGSVVREEAFTGDEPGLQAFGDYLDRHRNSLFMLLVDVAEEGFQLETIPYCSGKDRAALIQRKIGQSFYGTPYALTVTHGRQSGGRRDEALLMMALTRPQQLDPWLMPMRQHQAVLAGIYSLPQILPLLLPKDAPKQLLLIAQTSGGLRQAFFANRQLHFSRLTPLATGSTEEFALAAALEASKMHQYLSSQRLIERGQPLATRVVAGPGQETALRECCRDNAELNFVFADLAAEAKQAGMHVAAGEIETDTFFCHLLQRKSPSEQFAPETERQFFRLWQKRFGLKAASAVIFASGLLIAAKLGLDAQRLRDATQQIGQQTQLDQRQYDDKLRSLPQVSLTTDNLRALIGRYDQIDKRAQGPAPLLAQLSQSLDAYPAITLDRIDWRIAEQIEPSKPNAQPAIPPPPSMAVGPYAQLEGVARLPTGMAGNHRAQLTLVADFLKHLNSSPETFATMLQAPVDTQSEQTLKSGEDNRAAEAPKFTFRLTRKL